MEINNIKNCNIKFNITRKNIEKSGCEVIFVSVSHKLFATIFQVDDYEWGNFPVLNSMLPDFYEVLRHLVFVVSFIFMLLFLMLQQ